MSRDLDQHLDYLDQSYAAEEEYYARADIEHDKQNEEFEVRHDKAMDDLADLKEKIMADKKDGNIWEAILKDLDSGSTGIYVFPQPGITKVRLLVEPGREPEQFYQPVSRMFRGQEKTQYMAPCIVVEDGKWNMEVKYINMNVTIFKGILAILAGGEYDLLDPENGHGIQITRTGEGMKTRYAVMPSKDPVPVAAEFLEFDESLDHYAKELEKSDRKDQGTDWQEEDVPF